MSTAPVSAFRGIAVLMVLVYHTAIFSGLDLGVIGRTGYLGVDLFFVISGFVLFLPHARAAVDGTPPPSPWAFAIARAAKIVPSYLLALAVVAIASTAYLGPAEIVENLATHLAFVQNGFVDGFGPTVSVFWSLAVEVQFYVIFPLIAPIFRREPILTAVAMTMTALAYRFANAPCCIGDEQIMRQLPSYLDLFAAGMLAAYAVVVIRKTAAVSVATTMVTFSGLAGAWVLLRSVDGRAGWTADYPTMFGLQVGVVLAASCLAAPWLRNALANPVLLSLSTISYNVYLWHTVILIALRNHGVLGWQQLAEGWGYTFALSAAVTYLVEQPILKRAKAWVTAPRRSRAPIAAR